jgi:acyl carrier protein
MTKQEITNKINDLLVEEFEIAPELLTPEASLKHDLEIDSLDFVDIVVLINREFGFKPQASELKEVKTLSDFYTYIEAHI